MVVIAYHEHELKEDANEEEYLRRIGETIRQLRVPGLLKTYIVKGWKGAREGKFGVAWFFENEDAIVRNFGTRDNPKWPEDWLRYENEILAPFLDRHPDKIVFTDYIVLEEISY